MVPPPPAPEARPHGGAAVDERAETYSADPIGALALMALAGALFAAMNAFAHQAAATAPIAVVAGTRALVGAIISFLFAIFAKRSAVRPILAEAYLGANRVMWGRTIFGTAAMACTFLALGDQRMPLGDAATLFNLSPLLVAVLAPWLLGEATDRRLAWTLPIALAGVLAIFRPSFLPGSSHGSLPIFPVSVAVLAAFFSSFAMVLLRSTQGARPSASTGNFAGSGDSPDAAVSEEQAPRRSPSVEAVALHFSTFAAFVFLGFSSISGAFSSIASWRGALPAMLGAGVAAGCAQLAMTAAYRRDRAARVAALGYLNVPMSALLGAVLHHQVPTRTTLLGMLLIVGAGLFSALAPPPVTDPRRDKRDDRASFR